MFPNPNPPAWAALARHLFPHTSAPGVPDTGPAQLIDNRRARLELALQAGLPGAWEALSAYDRHNHPGQPSIARNPLEAAALALGGATLALPRYVPGGPGSASPRARTYRPRSIRTMRDQLSRATQAMNLSPEEQAIGEAHIQRQLARQTAPGHRVISPEGQDVRAVDLAERLRHETEPRGLKGMPAKWDLPPDISIIEGIPEGVRHPASLDPSPVPPQVSPRTRPVQNIGLARFLARIEKRLTMDITQEERTRIQGLLSEYKHAAIDPMPHWVAANRATSPERTRRASESYDAAISLGMTKEQAQDAGMATAKSLQPRPKMSDIQQHLMTSEEQAARALERPPILQTTPRPMGAFAQERREQRDISREQLVGATSFPWFDEYWDRSRQEMRLGEEGRHAAYPVPPALSKAGKLYDPHSQPIRERDLPDRGLFLDMKGERAQAHLQNRPRLVNLDTPLSQADYRAAQALISGSPAFQSLLQAKAKSFLVKGRKIEGRSSFLQASRDVTKTKEDRPRSEKDAERAYTEAWYWRDREELASAFSRGELPRNLTTRKLLDALNTLSPEQALGSKLLIRLGYDAGHGIHNFKNTYQPPTGRAYLRTFHHPTPPKSTPIADALLDNMRAEEDIGQALHTHIMLIRKNPDFKKFVESHPLGFRGGVPDKVDAQMVLRLQDLHRDFMDDMNRQAQRASLREAAKNPLE